MHRFGKPQSQPPCQPHGGSLRAKGPAKALASARTFGAKHRRGLPPNRWFQTQSQTQPQPQSQPHGGSLRANGPANAPPTPSPARAPSVRNIAGGFRPAADSNRNSNRNPSRMAAACGQTALPTPRQRPCQRAHLRCETSPGASAQPLVPAAIPIAIPAAWRQPAGKRPCKRMELY